MSKAVYQQQPRNLARATPWFWAVLEAGRDCNPPDWLVGAGVIRNLV